MQIYQEDVGVDSNVKFLPCLMLVILMISFSVDLPAQEQTQQELDAICEEAREARISADKVIYIEECVVKKQKQNRSACERFYADWGAWSGTRPPLYYDLPECVRAFEHKQSQRRR